MTVVCSIGSTDPWNAAGLGLDVRIIGELGARSVWVVAGVTAQDAHGLHASSPIAPSLIDAQFDALARAPIDAYRIGALLESASVERVAAHVAPTGKPVVYDPAIGPSAGGRFLDDRSRTAVRNGLLPLSTVVTPNLTEAAYFCGFAVNDVESMAAAGKALRAFGAQAALVKGGHLAGKAIDVLVDAGGTTVFEDERIATDMRGTGCVLAAALAVELARGRTLREAAAEARAIVRAKLHAAIELGGMRAAP
jgi:hydroxymethylpyrimidine/phosphomethylpyrimidine kinase